MIEMNVKKHSIKISYLNSYAIDAHHISQEITGSYIVISDKI